MTPSCTIHTPAAQPWAERERGTPNQPARSNLYKKPHASGLAGWAGMCAGLAGQAQSASVEGMPVSIHSRGVVGLEVERRPGMGKAKQRVYVHTRGEAHVHTYEGMNEYKEEKKHTDIEESTYGKACA